MEEGGEGKSKSSVSLRLPAELGSLEALTALILNFLKEQGVPQEKVGKVELATEEALVNIFNYAYPESEKGEVEVRCRARDEGTLIIEFLDTGIPFDVGSLPEPDLELPLSDRGVGGLGIFFMKRMIDEIRYKRTGDRNMLTFIVHKAETCK
jgi:anti-sigma regulatory factor (Ser/Thr protein kinase)